jgi:hypothetical protein
MKILVIFFCISSTYAQEVYFLSGKNFTHYNFNTTATKTSVKLNSGTGDFYEVGVSSSIQDTQFLYSGAIVLKEFNAVGGDIVSKYTWSSLYIGAKATGYYHLINHECNCYNRTSWNLMLFASLSALTLIDGRQAINASYYELKGTYYDLKKNKEFKGVFIEPSIGLQIKYSMFSYGAVSFGYSYNKAFNMLNSTSEKLGFDSHQLQFGIHLNTP